LEVTIYFPCLSSDLNIMTDGEDAVYPVRYLVQGMVLFRESLSQWVPIKKGVPNENCGFLVYTHTRNLCSLKSALSSEFVETAIKLLITRFMPLNPNDLERWMEDPEEWVNVEDKENEMWEYEIRVGGILDAPYFCSSLILAIITSASHVRNAFLPH
jgi:hypothetical protein